MTRSSGMAALAAAMLAIAGCGTSTTVEPTDTGGGTDGGSDAPAPAVDAPGLDAPGLDAPGLDAPGLDAPGLDAPATSDAGAADAPRPDAGMCVDPPPDPTRPNPVACSACRPPGTATGGPDCNSDADCPDTSTGTNGRCVFGRIGGYCSYDTCFDDGDCATGEVCLCDGGSGGGNTCVSGDCRVDADCAGGFACAPTFGSCGHYFGFVAYRCHRADDTCTVDADCGTGYCAYDEVSGHWACSTSECAG